MASEIVVPKPITASTSTNDNEIERLQSPPLTQMLHDLSLKNTASAVVYRIVLTGGPCGGKCWGRGTELMMWDGSVKKVEDIREGEWLMGDDSSPRVVRHGSLKRGNTEKDAAEFVPSEKQRVAPATYRITSANNQNALWTCNGDHILVLQIDDAPTIQSVGDDQYSVFAWQLENPSTPALTRVTPDSFPTIETAEEFRVDYMTKTLWRPLQFETDVNDFSLLSKDVRAKCKMFIMPQVHYSESGAKASIANRLQEILPSVIVAEDDESAWALGYILGGGDLDHANVQARLDAWTVAIGSVLPASELLHQLLAIYGVPVPGFGIPSELLTSSAQLRRALLAGIIDAAGRMDDDAVIVNGTAPFMTAVVQLARSLGFVTSRLESSVSLGDDTTVRISGSELSELKTNLSNTLAKLTVEEDLRSFAFECERVDHADYFGFTVCTPTGGETNGRFLMGDFVVTHNTTAMGTLTERFQALGWRVFRVPEAATMLLSGGHTFANLNKQQQYQFQAALLKLMMSLEEAFITLARSTHERCIVLCDRGTMDCRSYMPEDEWEQLTREVGMSTLQLRDERYDCVLHLVTAANGAAGFYTTEGHAARTEPPEFARELDLRVKNNWIGHPHYHVIDNVNTDFNGKIRRVMSTICQFVGLPGSIGMSKRKLLVKASCIKKVGAPEDSKKGDRIDFPESIRYQRFEVDHDYILRPDQDQGHQLRLRRRGLNGQYTYSYTLRYPDLHGQRVELKRLVTRREYFDLILQKDPSTQTVSKKRYSFLYNDQYFELDQFISPHPGLYLLEFYFEKDKPIDGIIPPFLEIEREVTGEKEYSMYNLARIGNHRSTKSLMAEDDLASALLHTKSSANDGHHHFSLTHAAASAPTSPQIKPASNALQVPNHKV